MALPNTNLSVADVKAELGADTNDVGRLCIHSNINMWSKKKPVRDGRVSIPFSEVGMSDNCGLVLHPFTGAGTQITVYNRPGTWVDNTGQHITPFRLGDFRGYQKEFINRPVEINANSRPGRILRQQTAISVTSVTPPQAPVVTLADFPNDLRLGVVIYGRTYDYEEVSAFVGCASALNQTDDFVAVDLTDVNWLYLDVKFCLIDGYVPWTTTMPTGRIMYEIPREYSGENANWINVPLETPEEKVKTFEIAGFVDAQQVQYIIEAYTQSIGRIELVPTVGTIIKITNINLPANTRISATARSIPLQAGVAYTAHLYVNQDETPIASRPMGIY